MTAVALPQPGAPVDADLGAFGCQQQLHRSIGTYASFAAGFSFVSILTTVFQRRQIAFDAEVASWREAR